jgi:hypothetical protein
MADIEITVRAAVEDPVEGIIGAVGAKGGEPEEADFERVRSVIVGQIAQLEGVLPIGWHLDVVTTGRASTQQPESFSMSTARRARPDVEVPPDRFDLIEEDDCAFCDLRVANQGDGVWYHLIAHEAEPRQGEEHDGPTDTGPADGG